MGGLGQGPFGEDSLALMDGKVEFLGRLEATTIRPVWMWVEKRLAENADGNPPNNNAGDELKGLRLERQVSLNIKILFVRQ